MSVNVPELVATMQYIDQHPEEHYQNMWGKRTPCGTQFCFAGTTLIRNGYEPIWRTQKVWDEHAEHYVEGATSDKFREPDTGKVVHADFAAADLLGIAGPKADALFYGYNSVATLRGMVQEYTDGAYQPPTDQE